LQGDLEIAVLLVRDEDAAVAGDVLAADDGAVLRHPAAARLVLARPAVAGLAADVPALEALAVEDRLEAFVAGLFLPVLGRRQASTQECQQDPRGRQENVACSHRMSLRVQ